MTAKELAEGISLADDFPRNPFSVRFREIENLAFRKQAVEYKGTWRTWESEGKPASAGFAECKAQREELRARMGETVAPVVHDLHITPLA